MSTKYPLTSLDTDQTIRYSYDDESQAQRVVLAGVSGLAEAIGSSIRSVNVNMDTKEIERLLEENKEALKTLVSMESSKPIASMKSEPTEKVVLVPEIKIEYVDRPVIVEKQVIVEVEKQVVVREVEIREIEKPVIVKEVVTVSSPVATTEKKSDILNIIQLVLLAAIAAALFLK